MQQREQLENSTPAVSTINNRFELSSSNNSSTTLSAAGATCSAYELRHEPTRNTTTLTNYQNYDRKVAPSKSPSAPSQGSK